MVLLIVGLSNEREYRVVEKVDERDRLVKRTWYHARQHSVHRQGGPAVENFDPATGKSVGEIWIDQFNHGKHRDDNLPAETSINPKSEVMTFEMYYRNGRLHRDDNLPANIHRNETTGSIIYSACYYEGYEHRSDDLPAIQEFHSETGKIIREEYFRNGERHRDRGPAIIEYNQNGTVIPSSLQFFRNGEKISSLSSPKP